LRKVLITGADRGVGRALAEVFLKEGWMVCAGQFMKEWEELGLLKKSFPDTLHIVPLDVSSDDSAATAFGIVSALTDSLDMLVNNAGIGGGAGDIFSLENVKKGIAIYNINCLGPLRITNAFLPLMEHPESLKRLCYVSSEAGSIGVCFRRDGFIYPMSKTALNMAIHLLYKELFPRGYTFRMYHPGWIRSYMSGKKSTAATYEPEETAVPAVRFFIDPQMHEDILRVIDNENTIWPF
jgi:NAD(P)-dependent dehydrogenase (short-subunit alcohol dehydrogenase family)